MISEFKLPQNLKELKRITKAQTSIKDERFIDLFLKFKKSNKKSVLKLKNWIILLKEKNYKVNINDLRNG